MNSRFPNVENPFRKGMSTYHDPCHGILSHVRSAWCLLTSCPEFDSASLLLTAFDGLISECPFDSLYSLIPRKYKSVSFTGQLCFIGKSTLVSFKSSLWKFHLISSPSCIVKKVEYLFHTYLLWVFYEAVNLCLSPLCPLSFLFHC